MAAGRATLASVNQAPSFARWAITLFVFLAFAFQSYLTQTHIHVPNEGKAGVFASVEKNAPLAKQKISGKQTPDKSPSNDDPANCPICQQMMHSGAYVAPDFVAVLLPSLPISILPYVIALPATSVAVSHVWRSRAPPHH